MDSTSDANNIVSITAIVPLRFAIEVKKHCSKHNVELISDRGVSEDQMQLVVRGTMDNLRALNDESIACAYGSNEKS